MAKQTAEGEANEGMKSVLNLRGDIVCGEYERRNKVNKFWEIVQHTYHRAEQLSNEFVKCDHMIGGVLIRIRYATRTIASVFEPALAHTLVTEPSIPFLTICVWDTVCTGVPMPSPPWTEKDYLARGEIRDFQTDSIQTYFHVGSGTLSLVNSECDVAYFWINDHRDVPSYERGAPFLTILHLWLRKRELCILHAGAVGTTIGGVLLAGKGGSGKSTVALSCLQSTLFYVSDDYTLVGVNSSVRVYSLYNTAKVDDAGLLRLPHLYAHLKHPTTIKDEKYVLFLHFFCSEKLLDNLPLCAIVLPQVGSQKDARMAPVSPVEAFKALAPSTIFQLSDVKGATLKVIRALVGRLPCYRLELGNRMESVPPLISKLIA